MKKLIWLILSLIIVILLFLIFPPRKPEKSKTSEATLPVSSGSNAINYPPRVKTPPNHFGASNQVTIPPSKNHSMPQVKTNLLYEQILQQWQAPIDFYGKVVDQDSNIIIAATISFIWTDLTAKNLERKSTTESDSEGRFSLVGKTGDSLQVLVSKKGYYVSRHDQDIFRYALGSKFTGDPQNPVIFNLRKKGQGAHLITSENGIRSTLAIPVSKDNIPVTIDFFQKRVSPSGQLEISQIKPPWREATNWSTSLSIPSGGLVETDEEFPFEAPQSGYQTTINLQFEKSDTHWITHFTKKYYIVFGQPQQYGLLQVESDLSQMTIFLGYAINPDGSRNLEPQ